MPPIVYDYLFTVIRSVLLLALTPLVRKGLADAGQTIQMAAWLTGALMVIGWGLWQKFGAKQLQLMSAVAPAHSTEAEVKQLLQVRVAPSVLTPADQVPQSLIKINQDKGKDSV